MLATCDISVLRRAAAIAAKAAATRDVVPPLAALKIVANGDISITGYDLRTWAIVSAGGEIAQTGVAIASARDFSAFCKSAASGDVELETRGTVLRLTCGRARAALPTVPPEDFPPPPVAPPMREMDPSFAAALAFALPACSTEQTRYYLCGVALAGDEVVATNGNSLHLAGAPGAPADAILPTAAAKAVANLLTDGGWFGCDATTWAAKHGDTRVGGALIEGTYPDFRRVVEPAEKAPVMAVAERDDLAAAVRQAALGERRGLHLAGGDGCLLLSSRAMIRGRSEARAEAACAAEIRAPFEAGIDSRYLADALDALPDGPIAIRHAPDGPVVLAPQEGSALMDRRAVIQMLRV